MKKIIKWFLIIVLLMAIGFSFTGCGIAEDTGSNTDKNNENSNDNTNNTNKGYGWYGNGSASTFTISNATQLFEFAKIVEGTTSIDGLSRSNFKGKTVILSADINLNNQEWESVGDPYDTARPFSGTFDGNGKTISGLKASGYKANRGLFGYVGEGGIVKNVVLININIEGSENTGGLVGINNGKVQGCTVTGNVDGGANGGGLVGFNRDSGIVQNCSFSGNASGSDAGGLVGVNRGGTIQNSYATGSVSAISTVCNTGGLVGYNGIKGMIQNCYTTSSVNGGSNTGGVVGVNLGMVQNCYATGNIIGSGPGGVAGSNSFGGDLKTIRNCVALNSSLSSLGIYISKRISSNAESSFLINNYGLIGMVIQNKYTHIIVPNANGEDGADVSADEAATQDWWVTAVNWDFDNVWQWDSSKNLPILR